MLANYEGLRTNRDHDWGHDHSTALGMAISDLTAWCRQDKLRDFASDLYAVAKEGSDRADDVLDLVRLVISALPNPMPTGLAIVDRDGISIRNPVPFVAEGQPLSCQVFTVGGTGAPLTSTHVTLDVDNLEIAVNGYRAQAAEISETGTLELVSDDVSRWSVLDQRGGAWFPNRVLRKFDYHGRAFFHGNNIVMSVPAGRTEVRVARGCEFQSSVCHVNVPAGAKAIVTISPKRLYDAMNRGWYGADQHVHMNYSGDQVCAPSDAARMQQGEGLHVMNLLAANWNTSLIYDQEVFEEFIGRDSPWSREDAAARWGVEYRNDLLGHFTALNLSAAPSRYYSGHPRSDAPHDWPANAVAAAECQDLGANVSYAHPLTAPLGPGGSSEPVFSGYVHNSQARELVTDAALGLVNSVDLTGHHNEGGTEATEYLYHRLLGCGIRLAATAGTDALLSHSRYGIWSNPPGWARAYAYLGDKPLSVEAWQDAVRAGKTFATNGPWLEFDVEGHGVGDSISCSGPTDLVVTVGVTGVCVEKLEIVGPEGVVATCNVPRDKSDASLTAVVRATGPMWLAAVARGSRHPDLLAPNVYAHTSPVWVDVGGRSVARAQDIAWCLDWIDRFERLVREVGTFSDQTQLMDLVGVLQQSRDWYHNLLQEEGDAAPSAEKLH